jgi:hypothetical protein
MKLAYLKKFFDSTDATASLRNAAFALVVVSGVVYLGAELVVGLVKFGRGITGDWNIGFGILSGAATSAKIAGKVAPKAPAPDPTDDGKDGSQ